MMGEADNSKMMLYWMLPGVNMESLKKRPISEKSGDFGHLIFYRKHVGYRTEEEPTKWKL